MGKMNKDRNRRKGGGNAEKIRRRQRMRGCVDRRNQIEEINGRLEGLEKEDWIDGRGSGKGERLGMGVQIAEIQLEKSEVD